MVATNHALSGALIGLAFGNPIVALPIAFAYHLAQDGVPHFDPPAVSDYERMRSTRFKKQLVLDASLCGLIVALLAVTQPMHWVTAALAAFFCTAPDLFWIAKFKQAQVGRRTRSRNWFLRLHTVVQWKTGPQLWWVEAAWFIGFGFIFVRCL